MKTNHICQKKFLWFKWYSHVWEEYDVFQKKKIIGKVPDKWEEGIYKVKWQEGVKEKCKKCGKRRTKIEKRWVEVRSQRK